MNNTVCFELSGRNALFTDPFSKLGGDKYSYHIPTYEALKGAARSVYWKPTFIWRILRVRVMNPIQTESKNIKPLNMNGGNTLAIYCYLQNVRYRVEAAIEWNLTPGAEMYADDRDFRKHHAVAERMIHKGGRRDVSLGTRECQALATPCVFDEGCGAYDDVPELAFGVMFHSFAYPNETGGNEFRSRFWRPVMRHGVIDFLAPEKCDPSMSRLIRKMEATYPLSCGLKEEALQYELD